MGRIVVGVDGSEPSKAALAWALEEAGLRSATLEVVCAYSLPSGWLGMGEAMGTTVALPSPRGRRRVRRGDAGDGTGRGRRTGGCGDDGGKPRSKWCAAPYPATPLRPW